MLVEECEMKVTRSRVTGLLCVIAGLVCAGLSMQLKPLIQLNEPGPKLFPMIGSIGLAICGVGIFFEKNREEEPFLTKEGWVRVLQLLGLIFLYVIGIKFVGFIIPMPFFLFFMILALANQGKRPKLIVAGLVAVVVTVAIYLIFTYALKVNLPMGLLFES